VEEFGSSGSAGSCHSGDGKVSFKTHLAEDLPEILADPEKMERIFINLFLNALQAVCQVTSKGLITAQTARV
jgi:nitrogen-specific signal transduction histidine kinase